ncbi:hypothetical protein RRG08_050042 [Elysia crispata]|uniref:Uncharacterized protein n=1 Tax=Elysia crispata TaxID=231223 RepID=A0AAE1EC71_9GAST|nr:hypothetical protein RRG08_050042 [Elysia crispata]
MASAVNDSSLTVRSNLPNVTVGPGGGFTTVAPCTTKDCKDDDKGRVLIAAMKSILRAMRDFKQMAPLYYRNKKTGYYW